MPAGKDFSSRNLRALGALRGFAVNPGLDLHREGAKHREENAKDFGCGYAALCSSVVSFVQKDFRVSSGG
ncbi:MAG: hypothetical protein DMG08_02825 [Acidobacteria bacterium]|nr:MAG: hypothetical protein DMG08_02825 [Acidobacteriota bacterium]